MQYSSNAILFIFGFLLLGTTSCAQPPSNKPEIINPNFDKKLERLLNFSIPLMSVQELKRRQNDVIILDTREAEEFQTSHIKGARYIGYKDFQKEQLNGLSKNDTIVLYCSVGYRSEKIGEKLKGMSYQNVYNLYGSIFEWVNNGYDIVNEKGQPTRKIHTYNKNWSRWVEENKAEKVW